jgi:hypothetical protein
VFLKTLYVLFFIGLRTGECTCRVTVIGLGLGWGSGEFKGNARVAGRLAPAPRRTTRDVADLRGQQPNGDSAEGDHGQMP